MAFDFSFNRALSSITRVEQKASRPEDGRKPEGKYVVAAYRYCLHTLLPNAAHDSERRGKYRAPCLRAVCVVAALQLHKRDAPAQYLIGCINVHQAQFPLNTAPPGPCPFPLLAVH